MNHTPKHIKELQLKIWLSKPPEERLLQFLKDNEVMFRIWKMAKEERKSLITNKANKV
jgi:hypothetical protein